MGRTADTEFSAHIVALLVDQLERAGVSRQATQDRHGITLVDADPPLGRMRLSGLSALFDDAADAHHRPSLGFELGSTRALGGYGLIEFTLRSVATVGEACLKLGNYVGAVNSVVRFTLDGATLTHRVPRKGGLGRHGNEYTMSLVLRFTQEISGHAIHAEEVRLAHEVTSPRADLERFFGTTRITSGAPVNQLVFRQADLALPVLTWDPLLHAYLHKQLMRLVAARTTPDDFESRVMDCLKQVLADGAPSLDSVATCMKMSPRTLQRRLAERDKNFFTLLDELRQELSRALLLQPNLSVSQVAFQLGYSDLRGFERAFSRWTGGSPRDWRKRR